MWPFSHRSKNAKAEAAVAVLGEAKAAVAERWLYFRKAMPFKDNVPLIDIITAFAMPMFEGLRRNLPPLRHAPDAVLLVIVAKGIEQSGTHSRAEIEAALGTPLPD